MTNHPGLAELLETECTNKTGGAPWHRHIHLIGGIAQQAAKYPPQLVRAVLKCLKRELEERGELNAVDAYNAGPVPEIPTVDPEWEERYVDVNRGIASKRGSRKGQIVFTNRKYTCQCRLNNALKKPGNPRSRPDGLIQTKVTQVTRISEAGWL
jgi:hypothetical protein